MGKHGIVFEHGINDMKRGWASASDWNYRVYGVWNHMIQRCYDEKYHETRPTYKDCYVCERWLKLSNFVEDVVKIPNYKYWLQGFNEKKNPYQLDKDIKSNGTNKCYCLEQCQFVDFGENTRQANKTRNNDYLKGENHPIYGKGYLVSGKNNPNLGSLIDRFDLQGNLIDTKYQFEYVAMGFTASNISHCCKGRRKSTGGYMFKYHEDK